ncbi:WD repeat-containing and planar cell polarity effector protein fritz isoform X2 [Venturia canescens]|uniref:WD repeat-containing and planar cell polarity effector protein fritz isoform X2 n=1 Tax=Venturia canescens TaxID=32260 RepID=UPI001C9C0568|nr:WD repeat-containing and planar cell polarity effector protein fritz isoform X2 [Venturia canescens]
MVLGLVRTKFELICHLRTEFDPLCITFNGRHENVIHSVEQKVSRKGEVTIEWQTYEVSQQDKLQRIEVISVPLPTHTSCAIFSPNQDMLLLCCIDGSITLHDHNKGTSNSVKAPFIPTLASWHSDGFVFTIGNDRGQFQHYDISLATIKSQMLNDDSTPAIIFDLSTYFRSQPALMRMIWNKKSDSGTYSNHYNNGNALFLLLFERGPLGVIRIIEGNNLSGDVLICRNLNDQHVDRATSLLLSMNWDTHPRACMHSLNQILNYLFKLKLTPERESFIQNALGSFHVPIRPISQAVEDEYGDEIRDLTRRFFHHLIRYRLFEKAFRLAIDLSDHDLFMDIHFYALVMKDMEMATAAKEKAQNVLSRSNSCSSSHSTCSRASCSLCSDSISDKETESYSGESESEDSPKRIKSKFHPGPKHSSRISFNKIPSLPMINPSSLKNSGIMSTSFNDISPSKTESLMSTAFNIPTGSVADSMMNPSPLSLPKPLCSNFTRRQPYRLNSSAMNSSLGKNSQSYDNLNDDLLSSTFGNLRILGLGQHDRSYAKSTGNVSQSPKIEDNLLDGTIAQDLISTRFDSIEPNLVIPEVSRTSSTSILDKIDSNVMSTSFSNLSLNAICENSATSLFRNGNIAHQLSTEIPHVSFHNSLGTSKPSYTTGKMNKLSFFNSSNNFMSTSFNDPDDLGLQSLDAKNDLRNYQISSSNTSVHKDLDLESIPPPPTMTTSLANYLNNLPKKTSTLVRNPTGMPDINETTVKFPVSRPNPHSQMLQRQSSVASILQSQHRNNNLQPIRNYRLNYDLDYVPFYESSEKLDYQSPVNCDVANLPTITNFSTPYHSPVKINDTKSSRIPQNPSRDKKNPITLTTLPIQSASNSKTNVSQNSMDSLVSSEKPKVKFSNTVTHILVPGTGQAYRPIQKRSVTQLHPMDPKRELAESLPLCLGNEDYLKDFQPLSRDEELERSKESSRTEEAAKIKVVHFGLL